MILVDTTIVSVATPAIINDLDAEVNSVVWVTSAYLLAYAVPVLITGRLGDRYGQKYLYMIGLVVFTGSSLWCGLTNSVDGLILARIFQGFGGALMTPQTMATITRIFPAESRGRAMALWGATAGVAMLVGPILGGVLVDALGWEWIFFINVPVGILGLYLAWRLVPLLETHPHRFDWLGVALSGIGMFLLVFGIQEGHQYDWGTIVGPITVWSLIFGGVFVLGAVPALAEPEHPGAARPARALPGPQLLGRQRRDLRDGLRGDRDGLPAHALRAAGPRHVADPGGLGVHPDGGDDDRARPGRRAADRQGAPPLPHRRGVRRPAGLDPVAGHPDGAGLGAVDDPAGDDRRSVSATPSSGRRTARPRPATCRCTRREPGAGIYNATRQVGSVLGAAVVAVLMDSRLAAQGLAFEPAGESTGGSLPDAVMAPFSEAMSQAMLVVPAAFLVGLVAVMFFQRPGHQLPQVGAPGLADRTDREEIAALRPAQPGPATG